MTRTAIFRDKPRVMSRGSLMRRIWKSRWAYVFLALPLLKLCLFVYYPILNLISMSFQEWWPGHVRWVGWKNYLAIFKDFIFWKSIANAATYTLFVVPIALAIGLFLSLFVFGFRSARVQALYKSALYLPGVASGVVMAMIWRWMFDASGAGLFNGLFHSLTGAQSIAWLGDTRTALGSIIFMALAGGFGTSVVLLTAAMGSVPVSLYESARLDGSSWWQEFRFITLPLLKPTVLFMLVTGTIGSFQVFGPIYMMTSGGPNYATTTIAYYIYNRAFEYFDFGPAAAMSLLLAMILGIVALIQFRLMSSDVEY